MQTRLFKVAHASFTVIYPNSMVLSEQPDVLF